MIQAVETSNVVSATLSKISGVPKDEVKECLKYNVITIRQLAHICGTTVFAIEARVRDRAFTIVHPFKADIAGPKFILRDQKFTDFISSQLLKYDG